MSEKQTVEDKNEEVEIEQEETKTEEVANDDNVEVNAETEVEEKDKFESLDAEFKELMEEKVAQAEDKYLRTHAEFENIKKRLEKEKYQAIDYASEKFAKDLLAPIDALDMAFTSSKNDDVDAKELLEKLKEGIELTLKSFRTVFDKNDIQEVDMTEFDPNFHNAVMQNDSAEHENGEIIAVLQKGYKIKDRLLRPAMVNICKK
jgi:molecular chaperone GrpE